VDGLADRKGKETLLVSASAVGYYGSHDDDDLLMESVHDFWRRHIAGDALPAELISQGA